MASTTKGRTGATRTVTSMSCDATSWPCAVPLMVAKSTSTEVYLHNPKHNMYR